MRVECIFDFAHHKIWAIINPCVLMSKNVKKKRRSLGGYSRVYILISLFHMYHQHLLGWVIYWVFEDVWVGVGEVEGGQGGGGAGVFAKGRAGRMS